MYQMCQELVPICVPVGNNLLKWQSVSVVKMLRPMSIYLIQNHIDHDQDHKDFQEMHSLNIAFNKGKRAHTSIKTQKAFLIPMNHLYGVQALFYRCHSAPTVCSIAEIWLLCFSQIIIIASMRNLLSNIQEVRTSKTYGLVYREYCSFMS